MQAPLIEQFVFNEQTLQAIVEHLPQAVVLVDTDGRLVLANGAAEALFGFNVSTVRDGNHLTYGSMFLADGITPCPKDELPLSRALAGDAIQDQELFLRSNRCPDGRWIAANATPLRNGESKLIGAMLICQDRSQAREAEAHREILLRAARESETQHRLLSESVPQLVWTCRPDGYCDYLNSRWVEYTGVLEGRHHGDGWLDVLHPDDRERVLEAWATAVEGGRPYDVEYRIRNAEGGYRWFKARGLPFRDADGRLVRWFGTSTDIDDQKRIEQKLARQSAELARSNADLQQFAYIAAHDLREPLRTIGSFTQLLTRNLPEEVRSSTSDLTDHIGAGVARMDALIGGLLSYATISAADPKQTRVDCGAVLRSALLDLDTSIQETDSEIISQPLPMVLGDKFALVRLFENLIGNALKYRSGEPPRIEIWAEAEDAYWRFAVKDNGLGIDARYHEQIFGLFTRLHGRRFSGIGLGLAYCKKIVEKHHGRIWVESASGEGATFFFTLPADNA